MVLRDREVVHHRRPGDVDDLAPHERAVGGRDVVREVRRERRVAEEKHLAGLGIELRMRRHGTGEPPVEVVLADGVERAGHHPRGEGGLHEREQLTRMPDDVRVAGVLETRNLRGLELEQAAVERAACLLLLAEPAAQDVAVPVARAPVVERDGVDHSVAVEPVIAAERRECGIRAVSVIGAVQLARDPSDDREVARRAFGTPGREVVLEEHVRTRFSGHGRPPFG